MCESKNLIRLVQMGNQNRGYQWSYALTNPARYIAFYKIVRSMPAPP
jgi:hypothetical protein